MSSCSPTSVLPPSYCRKLFNSIGLCFILPEFPFAKKEAYKHIRVSIYVCVYVYIDLILCTVFFFTLFAVCFLYLPSARKSLYVFGDFLIPFYSSEQPVFNKLGLGWRLRANIKLELLVLHLFLGFAGPAALLPFAGEHAKLRTACDPGWWE